MRFIVDAANQVRFGRTRDATRLTPQMRWPDVMGRDILEVVPPLTREGLTMLLAAVRRGHEPGTWQFPSAIMPRELRAIYAVPIRNHPGWVSIAVFSVPREVELPEATQSTGTNGLITTDERKPPDG